MLLTPLAAAILAAAPARPAAPATTTPAPGDHGKIAWFKGSFDAALAKAKAENKLVFIDFWTDWCGWCKRLDKDTFSDATVAEEMKDIICLSIDAESEAGAPLAKKFAVRGFPALLLLGPDGKAEDNIGGYLKPADFKKAIQRVRAGEGTVSGLRKKAAAEPANIEILFQLAGKLESLGDLEGHGATIAEIRKLDPDGKSLPLRRVELQSVAKRINDVFEKTKVVDPAPLEAFLAEEKHGELLYDGWRFMGQIHAFRAQEARGKGDEAAAAGFETQQRSALKNAWKHVPAAQVVEYGNTLAWSLYEARESLTAEEKAFALEVATKVNEVAKDNVNTIDTYACCLAMNGKKDEAIAQVRRCIELQPDNEQWKQRLAELEG